MKFKLSYVLFMICLVSISQEKEPSLPKFSIRANFGIPKVISSEQFKKSFSGIVTMDANANFKILKNGFAGLGYTYTYLKCDRYFSNPQVTNINTYLQMQNGYLKLGYDHFVSNTVFTTISLNTGYQIGEYNGVHYKNDSLKGKYPTSYSSGFIEPMIGIYFIVEEKFAIGGHFSYNYTFKQFDPLEPQFNQWGPGNYSKLSNNWNMSLLTFGFGVYYGIGK